MNIYRERAHLTSFPSKVYPSRLSYSDPDLYVQSPAGQLSWHISPDDMDLFTHLAIVPDVKWDGHSTEEKYERLGSLNG